MLDPPISQADIDNKTLFRSECGPARVLRCVAGLWYADYGDDIYYYVASDGSASREEPNFALTERIPKEPEMQSQVIVEDRRDDASEDAYMHAFGSYDNGRIVRPGNGEIYLKVADAEVLQLTGADAGQFHHMNMETKCRQLPHLRLRMILEEQP